MAAPWQSVKLGRLLHKSDNWIDLKAAQVYKELTIRLWGKGVVLRGARNGSDLAPGRRIAVEAGQFILSRIDARNGAIGIVPVDLDGAIVSNDFPAFDIATDRLMPNFLGWLVRTNGFVEMCRAASEGTTNRVRLKEERFLDLEIPLPPLTEQRRIVARIEELSAKINEAQQLRAEASSELALVLSRARDTCFTDISQRVAPLRLDDIANTRLGKMLSGNLANEDSGVPYLRNANVQWDQLDLSSVYRMHVTESEKKRFLLRRGDILVCEGGDIGKAAVWNDEIPGMLYQKALHRIRVTRNCVLPRFLLHHIIWAAEQGHFADIKTQTTIAHLTGVKLSAYPVFVPLMKDQIFIVEYLDSLLAKVKDIEQLQVAATKQVAALMPSILAKAFAGEL